MSQPKVQVVIPVYNSAKYIRRCLDSLCSQTYTNWEALIIDDASLDNSVEIVKKYLTFDNRFTLIENEINQGVSKVRNLALDKLSGEFTAFLDSDDYWESDMLETMVNKALEGDFDVVQCRFLYDYPGGRQVLPTGAFDKDIELAKDDMKPVYFKMATGINMNHVCMKLIRSELIKDIRFDVGLKTAEDLQFCIRMFCKVKKYCFINKALYHYCRNSESITGKGMSGKEKLKANIRVSSDMVKALPEWGIDTLFWRTLCTTRPYIIIVSKVLRILNEKIFSKNK